MTTIITRGEVDQNKHLRLAVDCDLPPGPVEVIVIVQKQEPCAASPTWGQLWGLGREVWSGIDANRYVADLREDREPSR